jgi:hypothetical protein
LRPSEGDPITLAEKRSLSFSDRKIIDPSDHLSWLCRAVGPPEAIFGDRISDFKVLIHAPGDHCKRI